MICKVNVWHAKWWTYDMQSEQRNVNECDQFVFSTSDSAVNRSQTRSITYSLLIFQMLFALLANLSPTTCFRMDPSFLSFQCFIATVPFFIHSAILQRQFQQVLLCGGWNCCQWYVDTSDHFSSSTWCWVLLCGCCHCCQWYVVGFAQHSSDRFSGSTWCCCSCSPNEVIDEMSICTICW